MGGGLIQLIIAGGEDKILMCNPEFSYFIQVYRKYSNFSIFNYQIPITSSIEFGSLLQVEIPKNGDLLKKIMLKIDLPKIEIQYNNPLAIEIEKLKKTNNYKDININIYNYNLYNLNVFKNILEYQQQNTQIITNYQLFQYDVELNTEIYSVVIPKIDLNQFIQNSNNEYFFNVTPDSNIFDNPDIIFNYPKINTPEIINDYTTFYNKILLYANRNNKLSSTFNLIKNLFDKNDNTVLLTSNNIKNILIKNIKDNIYINSEFGPIDILNKYIDSIRFIRPYNLYDHDTIINNLHGGDNDLINFDEYKLTYYETKNLIEVDLILTIDNMDSRLIYVLKDTVNTSNTSNIIVKFNDKTFELINILKIDKYYRDNINSFVFYNNFDILNNKNNIQNIKIQITPITDYYTFNLNNFSELLQIKSFEKLLDGTYRIILDEFKNINFINRFIYFYYGNNNLAFCILIIKNFYIDNEKLILIGSDLNFNIKNFDNTLLYLIDNTYLIESNDIKNVTQISIDLDSFNLYKHYISNSNNTNFYLDGTTNQELIEKNNFKTNFTNYIIKNLIDNYSILYNIISNNFKQSTDNLFFQMPLNDIESGISNYDALISIGNFNFDFNYQKINNNYLLTLINDQILNYNQSYLKNWNNLNNLVQNSSYMVSLNNTLGYLQNNTKFIQINIDKDISSLINFDSNVELSTNNDVFIGDIYLSNISFSNISNIYNIKLNIDDNIDNLGNIFNIKNGYYLNFYNVSGNSNINTQINNIYYADDTYKLNVINFSNNSNYLFGNYILEDYIFQLSEYIKNSSLIYIENKYDFNNYPNPLTILDNVVLIKFISLEYHKLINNVDNRNIELINKITTTNDIEYFISDFEYLTDGIKLTNFLYENIVFNFYDNFMINGYYFFNSFQSNSIIVSDPNISSFSNFINFIIDDDPIYNKLEGQLLKTYLYFNYGNQIYSQFNSDIINSCSIRDGHFDLANVQTLEQNLRSHSNIHDVNNICNYLSNVTNEQFTFKNYKYNINPHLFYAYLNIGFIENTLSSNINGNIDYPISQYSNITYSDIDSLISQTLTYFIGTSNISTIGNVYLLPETEYYSNIIGFSTINENILFYNNDSNSIILNDLIEYSNNRIPDSKFNQTQIDTINIFAKDIKQLIRYFNDYIDNINTLNIILNYNNIISENQLYNKLNINTFTSLEEQNLNDYELEYFKKSNFYDSLNNFRISYVYNDLINAFDNDSKNYYNFLININNTIPIGSSYKILYDLTSNYFIDSDIFNYIQNDDSYGQINVNISNVKDFLIDLCTEFQNDYKIFSNNNDILNIRDDIELNSINQTIKSINLDSGGYFPSLSSLDQFEVYNRKFFGFEIDKYRDLIFNNPDSITHAFYNKKNINASNNISNIEYYNNPILDTYKYEYYTQTYDFQIKRIQSYFFGSENGIQDYELNYIKKYFALENYNTYLANPIYITQINKLFNYSIPSDVELKIVNQLKIDSNYNIHDFDIQRILSNSQYYIQTLNILDNYIKNQNITTNDLNYMIDYLSNNVIFSNYKLNSDNSTITTPDKNINDIINYSNITLFSNGLPSLTIPFIQLNTTDIIDMTTYTINNSFDIFYNSLQYLLFDLYILDGNMRCNYNTLLNINKNNIIRNIDNQFIQIYRTLISEYFYLILRGKIVIDESIQNTINYSLINKMIKNKNYDKLIEYYLNSIYDDDIKKYDLFNIKNDYKINNIEKNHLYSENYAIIFSIKNSFNDKNFEHLINLTNYNHKYLQYINNNPNKTQKQYLSDMNISNIYQFYGNIVVTNDDYNKISNSSILNSNIFLQTFNIEILGNNGYSNLLINMNDIRVVKQNIIKYYLDEIKNSNVIINNINFDSNANISYDELNIDQLNYNGNIITDVYLYLSNSTIAIQQYDNTNKDFNPSNISSLKLWLDGADKSNIFKDNGTGGTTPVINFDDNVKKWKNKALTGEIFQINANITPLPIYTQNGINFNGSNFFNCNIQIEEKSTIFIVTDIAIGAGYCLYFDNGVSSNIGPTIFTDGQFGDFIYNDYNFNLEDNFGYRLKDNNIFCTERINGEYINGYLNGYSTFNKYYNRPIESNITMSVFPGYKSESGSFVESFEGNIMEILIFNDILSNDEKYKINQYLGRKWKNLQKINKKGYVQYYYLPFDYLPKLYDYEVSNSNIIVTHNHYFDETFANIYEDVYIQYNNLYNDITYQIGSNIDTANIVPYMYFSDFIDSIKTLVIQNNFNYNLELNNNTFNIKDNTINIDSDILLNYKSYIDRINQYKSTTFNIKDFFYFMLNPLKYDTEYTKYQVMNFGSEFDNNSNIYYQKVEKLIEKTNTLPFNNTDRLYHFNEILNWYLIMSMNGKLNYEEISLSESFIGNSKLPTIPINNKYVNGTYDYYNYQTNGDSNVLVLNKNIDINNKKVNIIEERERLYNNVNAELINTQGDIDNYYYTNNLIDILSLRPGDPNGTTGAVMSWIEKLGMYFSDFYELYIGGELIDRVDDDIINCLQELYIEPGMIKAFAKMIGQDKKLIIKKSSIGNYSLYIDIPYYFNRNKNSQTSAIPIIALLYNKINIKFKIKTLNNLLNKLEYTTVKQLDKLKMTLMVDYILLDTDERKKFAESKHEYIIEQFQSLTYNTNSFLNTNQIKLNFKNPTKTLIWFAQLKENIDLKQYYNYTSEPYYLNINKYIDKDETDNKYLSALEVLDKHLLIKFTNLGIDKLTILKRNYDSLSKDVQSQLKIAVKPSQIPIIKKSELKVNGHNRFKSDSDETSLVRPYTFFNNSYLNGINVYNFGLYPMQKHPSGTINFSFLNDLNLLIDFNNIQSKEIRVTIIGISYNLFRVMSGYGGLGFDIK